MVIARLRGNEIRRRGRRRAAAITAASAASSLLFLFLVVVVFVLLGHTLASVVAEDAADPAATAADKPKVFRGTAGEDDSIVWVWWAYARDSVAAFFAHWDDLPSNPFKIVVALFGVLFWPFGVAAHFVGNHVGAPAYLDEYVGDYINGHNVSVYYRMLLGYRQEL